MPPRRAVINNKDDSYLTPDKTGRSFFSVICRLLHMPVLLYPSMFGVVWRASGLAKRGTYGYAEWVQSSQEALAALEDAGARCSITGRKNIADVPGPAVFIGNHMSTLETFVLPAVIQPLKDVTFIVKESLIKYPLFGSVMRSRDPIVVGRANARDDYAMVMREGEKRLKNGISIIVFPQSTRSSRFDTDDFNSLGVKLARRAKTPIIPIALKTDAWGNGNRFKDLGRLDISKRVHIHLGPAMAVEGNGSAERERIIAFIRENLARWSEI